MIHRNEPHAKNNETTTTPKKIITPYLIKDGNLKVYEITDIDIKIAEVYDGNFFLNNDDTHLHGDIKDDDKWQ